MRFGRNILAAWYRPIKVSSLKSLSFFLSLSAKRTSLPRPPFPPPCGKRAPVRPRSVRIHHTFVRLLGKYTAGASDRTGYVLRFQKNGFNTALSPVSLILRSCVNTLSSSPELFCASYILGRVSTGVSSLLIPIWMFIVDYFLIPRPNDWAQVQSETWLPCWEDLRLKFEGCRGASGCPSPTVHWICN